MKYDYSVIYNGKFYRAGEEVPVVTEKNTSENEENKISVENEGSDIEKTENEEIVSEVKKTSKRRTKA